MLSKFWSWLKSGSTEVVVVCEIPIRWNGVKELCKAKNDWTDEIITVHIYSSGHYDVFASGLSDTFYGFSKFKHWFESYKKTMDKEFIRKYIVWEKSE